MESIDSLPLWYAILAGIIGVLLVGAGYRLLRMAARFAAALLGAAVGCAVGAYTGDPIAPIACGAGLGIVGFLLGNVCYYLIVAFNGGGAGLILAATLAHVAGMQLGLPAAIAGTVAGIVLGLLLERPIGIFGTSLIGGALLAVSAQVGVAAAGVNEPARYGFAYLLLLVGATISGCFLQAATTRNLPEKPKGKGKDSTH